MTRLRHFSRSVSRFSFIANQDHVPLFLVKKLIEVYAIGKMDLNLAFCTLGMFIIGRVGSVKCTKTSTNNYQTRLTTSMAKVPRRVSLAVLELMLPWVLGWPLLQRALAASDGLWIKDQISRLSSRLS